ncbi:hypothetical protein HWV62_20372 [Athelia sp. TMB]|nr:hypothetical protein HWV62_20372 [Athelia sp. TMB]
MTDQIVPQSQSRPLDGKLALITGCTGGIGKATAFALANQGCSIAVHYNSAASTAEELATALTQLGVKAATFQADLSAYENVRALHAEVVARMGHPDVLFNNAGTTGSTIGMRGDIADVGIDEFEHIWRANTGSHYLVRAQRT